MFICFIFSPKTPQQPPTPQRIDGRGWSLDMIRSADDGPWYPQVDETTAEKDYRFFAGRLAGASSPSGIPAFAPFASSSAADWSFPSAEPDGSWIALKFDRATDTLSIASDLFLLQRWYYAEIEGRWLIANSLRFLATCLDDVEIDWRGAVYMLSLSYLPGRYTPLKNVFSLRSGETLTIEQGRGRIGKRAALPVYERAPFLPENNASAAIHEAIHEAVASELAGVDQVIVPLSGGIDSRFLLAGALRILPREKITTVTFGHPSSLDFRIGTSLARIMNVASVALPMDDRPVRTLMAENFASAEGIHSAWPFFPVQPYREMLGRNSLVLSGYIGDFVFGSYELSEQERQAKNPADALIAHVERSVFTCSPDAVRPFMADRDLDPHGFFADLRKRADSQWPATYYRWIYENCLVNRTNFALEVYRDCAYYLAPYIHRCVLDVAHALPSELRWGERAFFRTLRDYEPRLYNFPTTANFGFALNQRGCALSAVRAWRKTLNLMDEKLAARWGRIIYQHPRTNYAHMRELSRERHRDSVLQCLEELQTVPALNPAALSDLRDRYRKSRPLHWPLLRELFTLHLWLTQYGKR